MGKSYIPPCIHKHKDSDGISWSLEYNLQKALHEVAEIMYNYDIEKIEIVDDGGGFHKEFKVTKCLPARKN